MKEKQTIERLYLILFVPLLAVFILIFLLSSKGLALSPADPEMVARVNGEPVTRVDFQRMVGNPLTRRQLQEELGTENADPRELARMALRRLIHRRLLLQEADRRKIVVTDGELDKAVTSLRRRFDDLKGFGQWMKEQGFDDRSLLEAVRADMLSDRVLVALVEGVLIPDKLAQQYYDAHREEIVIGEEVRLRIIAVKDKAAAEEILAALWKGASFGRLARQRSIGIRAAQGGDTGWVDSSALPQTLQKAVLQMKPGDVAGPLQKGPEELLIVGLEERRPVRAKSLAEARSEIERRLLPAKQQEAVHAWFAEQEKISKIEVFSLPR